jgi:hypothetical protein
MNQQVYERPILSEDDKAMCTRYALKIATHKGRQAMIAIVALVLEDNMRLTKEINDHRAALGFEPLPEYQPKL